MLVACRVTGWRHPSVGRAADLVNSDPWFLPADVALLRGISWDAAAAADALEGGV